MPFMGEPALVPFLRSNCIKIEEEMIMRRRVWLGVVMCLLLVPGIAASESARISLYAGDMVDNCNLADWGPKLHEVYVVYSGPGAFSGAEFMIEPSHDCGLTYVGETIVQPRSITVGRTDTGIAIVTGECMYASPVLMLKVYYYGKGVSGHCSELRILRDPRSPDENGDKIHYIDCSPAYQWADPGHMIINPDEVCTCGPGDTSPVASTTWGGIKAMYLD
jgi:hypothetical protein